MTNNVNGTISFVQIEENGNVTITIDLTGLPKNVTSLHGLHVHNSGIKSTSSDVGVCKFNKT
jgi:Cu/Zn superoxide dismutase